MDKKRTNMPMPYIEIQKSNQEISNSDKKRIDKLINKKYLKNIKKREKSAKTKKINNWLWNKGFVLINTFLAFVAAIAGIISVILQLTQ